MATSTASPASEAKLTTGAPDEGGEPPAML